MKKILAFCVALLVVGCSSDEEVAFRMELDINSSGPSGLHFQVEGTDTYRIWAKSFASLDVACSELSATPLRVICLTENEQPCGVAEIVGVCCWAPNILSSPVVKGTAYVAFDGAGGYTTSDGRCEALDGSSTHGDGPGPDAGS